MALFSNEPQDGNTSENQRTEMLDSLFHYGASSSRLQCLDGIRVKADCMFGALDRLEHGEHDMTVIKADAAEWTGGCQCEQCAINAHAAGARVHLPLPDVPEGVWSAVHGVRECQARKPELDARAPVDLRELERRRAELLQCLRHPTDVSPRGEWQHRGGNRQPGRPRGCTRPIEQCGVESELSWVSGLRALPAKRTEDWKREYSILRIDSHQYLPPR